MKKSLLALAAMGAFAGSAQAQSSVAVYGVFDGGYSFTNRNINGTATQTTGATSGNQSTSRLGFRGTEDLGGGRSAQFVMELGISAVGSSALSGSTNPTNNATLDNRQSFIGLSDKNLGSLKLGRQYSLAHEIIGGTDAGGANGVIGANTYVGANSGTAWTATSIAPNSSYMIRLANAVNYESPRIAGVQAKVMVAQNKSNSGVVQTNTQGYTGFALNYTQGPLFVGATRSFNSINTVEGTTAGAIGAAFVTAASTAYNIIQTETAVGASYDFKIAKVFANYIETKADGSAGTTSASGLVKFTNAAKRTAQNFGVSAPITPTVTVFGSYGGGKSNQFGALTAASATTQDFSFMGYQAGATYTLSKRTNLYAIYGRQSGDTSATTTFVANAVSLGARHTF
jgi:predicted porin